MSETAADTSRLGEAQKDLLERMGDIDRQFDLERDTVYEPKPDTNVDGSCSLYNDATWCIP